MSVGVSRDEKLVVFSYGGGAQRFVVGGDGQKLSQTPAAVRVHRPAEHVAAGQARQQNGRLVVDAATAQVNKRFDADTVFRHLVTSNLLTTRISQGGNAGTHQSE